MVTMYVIVKVVMIGWLGCVGWLRWLWEDGQGVYDS